MPLVIFRGWGAGSFSSFALRDPCRGWYFHMMTAIIPDPHDNDTTPPAQDAKARAEAELAKLLALSNRTLTQLAADSQRAEWGL